MKEGIEEQQLESPDFVPRTSARPRYAGLSNHTGRWFLDSDANVGSKGPSTRLWPFRLLRQIEDIRSKRAVLCIFFH